MLVRRERDGDAGAIAAVTAAAFGGESAVEVGLVDALRASTAWLPALSLVAVDDGAGVIGHVVCTRAHVGIEPALGLGPLSVHPGHQRRGVGSALMHAVLGAAEALGEPLVVLLGSPAYYRRFGFRPAAEYGITPPDPEWRGAFQARLLGEPPGTGEGIAPLTWSQSHRTADGAREFAYAPPFLEL